MTAVGHSVSAYIADDSAVLANTTGRTGIGGYCDANGGTYHSSDNIVSVGDVRIAVVGNYLIGSIVVANDLDVGLTVTASSNYNLIWSDNSSTSHDTTSSTDWTNGFLVDDLRTDTQTISY